MNDKTWGIGPPELEDCRPLRSDIDRAGTHDFCSDLAWDDLDTFLIQVDKENSMEFPLDFLHYLYNYYMVYALLSHTYHVTHHVMSCDVTLWLPVMWRCYTAREFSAEM